VHPSRDDARALDHCAHGDVSGIVATRCASASPSPTRTRAVLAFILPDGAETPRPGASYAMLLADGLIRAGTADRRGAVEEPAAPDGSIRLLSLASATR
jgi:hypothetical protein